MITMPSDQPIGSQFYVTRRPDIFMEFCAPCEEILAGPYADQAEAFRMTPIVREWLRAIDPYAAMVPMGVLCLRPTLTDRPDIEPMFNRSEGEVLTVEQVRPGGGTRLSAVWILKHAAERCESYNRPIASGFEPTASPAISKPDTART